MDIMNESRIRNQVSKLHNNAKNGFVTLNGIKYSIEFDRYMGTYTAYDPERNIIVQGYNTRKISIAKKWFKEYMEV